MEYAHVRRSKERIMKYGCKKTTHQPFGATSGVKYCTTNNKVKNKTSLRSVSRNSGSMRRKSCRRRRGLRIFTTDFLMRGKSFGEGTSVGEKDAEGLPQLIWSRDINRSFTLESKQIWMTRSCRVKIISCSRQNIPKIAC